MEPHGLERLGCGYGVELQGSAEDATALTAMRGRAAAKKRRAAIRNGEEMCREGKAEKRCEAAWRRNAGDALIRHEAQRHSTAKQFGVREGKEQGRCGIGLHGGGGRWRSKPLS